MFTMAEAIRVVTDWAGDPGSVVEYGVRFTRPVVVPNDDGATIEVSGKVAATRRQHRPRRPHGDQRRPVRSGSLYCGECREDDSTLLIITLPINKQCAYIMRRDVNSGIENITLPISRN
ncbi:hypothetical protein SALBM311S_06499 [Streptomyces alboniger]